MSSVPRHLDTRAPSVAESLAAEVGAARKRLDNGRELLDRYRSQELAEAEALSLAHMKADTHRSLAHQAAALRDAERAFERTAIERRAADLAATKEAQRAEALEAEAKAAAVARTNAEQLELVTQQQKIAALEKTRAERDIRLAAEREALQQQRQLRGARWRLAWLRLRGASPLMVGIIALLIGAGIGALLDGPDIKAAPASSDEEPALKLATTLSVAATSGD